jgi:hypothetical protein
MEALFWILVLSVVIFVVGTLANAAAEAASNAANTANEVLKKGVDIATSDQAVAAGKAFLEGMARGYVDDQIDRMKRDS